MGASKDSIKLIPNNKVHIGGKDNWNKDGKKGRKNPF
jgi:hypothetical protein